MSQPSASHSSQSVNQSSGNSAPADSPFAGHMVTGPARYSTDNVKLSSN